LTPQDAVLIDQIGDDVLLLGIQPAGQGGQNNPDEHAVNHGAESTLAVYIGDRASGLSALSADLWDITASPK